MLNHALLLISDEQLAIRRDNKAEPRPLFGSANQSLASEHLIKNNEINCMGHSYLIARLLFFANSSVLKQQPMDSETSFLISQGVVIRKRISYFARTYCHSCDWHAFSAKNRNDREHLTSQLILCKDVTSAAASCCLLSYASPKNYR